MSFWIYEEMSASYQTTPPNQHPVIKHNHPSGIAKLVEQQFALGNQVLDGGLIPIIEPEVDIKAPDKGACEETLKSELHRQLDLLPADKRVIFKLSIPTVADLYREFTEHPKVIRVVALSGGYTRDEANRELRKQHGMIASFSRALAEGLSAQQSDADFDRVLDESISSIYQASTAKL
jgi:fructose-bisphosphate aldolase, class I